MLLYALPPHHLAVLCSELWKAALDTQPAVLLDALRFREKHTAVLMTPGPVQAVRQGMAMPSWNMPYRMEGRRLHCLTAAPGRLLTAQPGPCASQTSAQGQRLALEDLWIKMQCRA